ncbi:hypothetical protein [Vibrio quintilis]|uniref:Uncharacterized protein n=1 Tax=Vibrio quintilis TaxID=1117707 RepID=A0A1M7YYI9_9VIBR|nr:hypothetical protein [Vibrio quintilis]SHO57654.1 hypothetical protein VQ7734_03424 [Vibrio quintilis]
MFKFFIGMIFIFLPIANASEIVFEGYPIKKIETNEHSSGTSLLNKSQGAEYKVKIIRDGENYYWSSRGNTQVVPVQSGFYITYIAVNGSGYIRIFSPAARAIFKQLSIEEQAKQFLYFEHLIHQMGSITYYGR